MRPRRRSIQFISLKFTTSAERYRHRTPRASLQSSDSASPMMGNRFPVSTPGQHPTQAISAPPRASRRWCECSTFLFLSMPGCLAFIPSASFVSSCRNATFQRGRCNWWAIPATCKTATISYGSCNRKLERGLTESVNRFSPIRGRFSPISATKWPGLHFCNRRQFPVRPDDIPEGVSGVEPCRTPHECGPLWEVMRRDWLVHTIRWGWRSSRRNRPQGGERLDPETQTPARPEGPGAVPSAAIIPPRVQKCPFHVGPLHVSPDSPLSKNARFSYGGCH